MSGNRPPGALGLDLRGRAMRQCGLCGELRQMTKAHVPPQAAGNTASVTSGITQIRDGALTRGRQAPGGMWVRGLCQRCNGLAGQRYDLAYGDFARRLSSFSSAASRIELLRPWDPPAVSVAPGLVSRSILFGMFAISPNLRVIFPGLAAELLAENEHITMPQGASLRLALLDSSQARLAGPVGAHRVLTIREDYETFAEVFFRPLAWVLAPKGQRTDYGTSVMDRQNWATADTWLQYGPDVVAADLRDLVRHLPVVTHPLAEGRDEWIEMMSDEITSIVEGQIPA